MKRLFRYIGIALGGLLGLAIVACAIIYFVSERILKRTWPIPPTAIAIPADAASIAEGRRIAILRGCLDGCHGKQGEGAVMFDKPMIATLIAPNLTAAARKYSDAELAVVIRHGLRPDGRSLIAMPSEEFAVLSDADLGRLIAFLKTLPSVPGPEAGVAVGPLGRLGLVQGKFKLAAEKIARSVPPPKATSEEAEMGRYLARSTCGGCHAPDLRGDTNPTFTSSDLGIVAGYSAEAFTKLMRTGAALGDRQLKTMSPYARDHLSLLTDAEIAALYSYLHALPPVAPAAK